MKIRNITSLSLFLFSTLSLVHAMELVDRSAVSSANDLKLYTNHRDFYVEDENGKHFVEKHNINPLLKAVAQHKALEKFIGNGYIRINKFKDGKYALVAKVRGNGGGPVAGACALWGTRLAGWGTFAALVWASHGEMLMHSAEYMHGIEAAANTLGLAATLSPLP